MYIPLIQNDFRTALEHLEKIKKKYIYLKRTQLDQVYETNEKG